MRNGTRILLFSIVLFGGGVVLGAMQEGRTQENVLTDRTSTQVSVSQEQELSNDVIPVKLVVDGTSYDVEAPSGSTVEEMMVKAQETTKFSFTGTSFPGMGFFVEEINGLSQDARAGTYWIYYINGQKAEVGISAYEIKEYEVVSWRYEKEY